MKANDARNTELILTVKSFTEQAPRKGEMHLAGCSFQGCAPFPGTEEVETYKKCFRLTWNSWDEFERPQDPEGSQGGQVDAAGGGAGSGVGMLVLLRDDVGQESGAKNRRIKLENVPAVRKTQVRF